MRIVTRDPNITPEQQAARRASMACRSQAMRDRTLAADMAYALRSVGPPMTSAEFEAELTRREAQWDDEAAARAAASKTA